MISGTLVLITSNLAQALGAAVLAMVLLGFYRTYGRRYLLTWAWSSGAFCLSLAAGAALLLMDGPPASPLRFGASFLGLAAGYWQAALLLFGTYEVVADRKAPARLRRMVLGASALVALASALAAVSPGPHRELGARSLLLGAAFVAASLGRLAQPAAAARGSDAGWWPAPSCSSGSTSSTTWRSRRAGGSSRVARWPTPPISGRSISCSRP